MNTARKVLLLSGCLLLLTIPVIADQAQSNNVQLVIPTSIEQPQNDDERFFNFRLQNFTHVTEPLIQDT